MKHEPAPILMLPPAAAVGMAANDDVREPAYRRIMQMSVADRLGFGPKREVKALPDGSFRIRVTPPAFIGGGPQHVDVTFDQLARVQAWLNGCALIQDALPDLCGRDREILMTGLGPEDANAELDRALDRAP